MLQKYGKGGSDAKWMQKKILYWQIFEEVALNYDCAAQKKKKRIPGFQAKIFKNRHVTHHTLIKNYC